MSLTDEHDARVARYHRGQTITINDGTNPLFTYTSTGTDTVGNLITAINAANTGDTLDVSAALSGDDRQSGPHRHQRHCVDHGRRHGDRRYRYRLRRRRQLVRSRPIC